MKRLIFDYYRRWVWVLILLMLLEVLLGWLIATNQHVGFEFWALILALWPCGILLSLDLQRGVARPALALPLTARQVGRSWWFATVGILGPVLAACHWLGVATAVSLNAHQPSTLPQAAMASLITVLCLGSSFVAIHGINQNFFEGRREMLLAGLYGWLSTVMIFGTMFFATKASKGPVIAALLISLGGILTFVGWCRAEKLAWGRAAFRASSLRTVSPAGRHQAADGVGGLRYLLQTLFLRGFVYASSSLGLMGVMLLLLGQDVGSEETQWMFGAMGSFMACGLVMVLQFLPLLRHLRALRALPIPPALLAALAFGAVLLPVIASGALVATVFGLLQGGSAALWIWSSFLFILGPASLCVFFAVWRGDTALTFTVMTITVMGAAMLRGWLQHLWQSPEIALCFSASLAVGCFVLAFLLARFAIQHSSAAYRIQASPFGQLWGTGC